MTTVRSRPHFCFGLQPVQRAGERLPKRHFQKCGFRKVSSGRCGFSNRSALKGGVDGSCAALTVPLPHLSCREQTPWTFGRDVWWHKEIPQRPEYCEPEWMDAEDPLFMLYTSGSTGKPKGVLHTTGEPDKAAGSPPLAGCQISLSVHCVLHVLLFPSQQVRGGAIVCSQQRGG